MKPILVKKDQVKPGGLKNNKLKTAPVAKKTVVTGPLKVIPGPVTKKPGAPKPARAKVTVADKAQAKPVAWQKLVAPKQVPAVGVTKPGRGPKRGLHAGID